MISKGCKFAPSDDTPGLSPDHPGSSTFVFLDMHIFHYYFRRPIARGSFWIKGMALYGSLRMHTDDQTSG